MARCFIGVLLPEEIKSKIACLQEQLKRFSIDCKLVGTGNLHICLSFLGEIDENNIEAICEKLDTVCQGHTRTEACVNGIKTIPNERYVRVLALDVQSEILESLRISIKKEVGGDSKPLHITLCRIKAVHDKTFVEKLKEVNFNLGTFPITSIYLIKSELKRDGPAYTCVHESKLS